MSLVAPTFRQLARDYAGVILATPGLQSYWPLDELAGSVARDYGPARIDGTYGGGSFGQRAPRPVRGGVGLSGSTNTMRAGVNYGFAGTAPFSAECWVFNTLTTADTVFRRILSTEPTANQGWAISWQASGNIGTTRGDSTGANGVGGVPVVTGLLGSWVHLVFTYDGATTDSLYINGQRNGFIGTDAKALPAQTTQFTVGNRGDTPTSTQGFTGEIADVAVYNRPLSPTEAAEHYDAGRTWALS